MSKNPTQSNKPKIPKLRFPGFDGVWEEKKLGQVSDFFKGKGISKDDISDHGLNKCIRYGELYTDYSEIIKEVRSKTNIPKTESLESEKNDVIIPSSGETALDIATVSCVKESGILLGGDLNVLRLNDQDGEFFAYYLSNFQNKNIARLAQGNSVVHLYASHLKDLKINLPQLPEQQKIASFLSDVNAWIENLREQKKSLESYKKGLMQKIFSQQIRFKDEKGNEFPEWEEKRLGEVCEKKSSAVSANSLEENIGEYNIYGATGFLKKVDFYQEEEPFISIVKDGAGVGRILLCEAKSSVLGTLDIIKPKSNTNLYFLYLLLGRLSFLKYTTGLAIPHIYFKDYSKEKIKLPSLPEQQKIAEFLSSVDTLLESKQQQITKAEEWKKGLMQGLFV